MTDTTGGLLVTVPATSANLGPGYDCFALALSLRDVFTVRQFAGSARPTHSINGRACTDSGTSRFDLLLSTYRAAMRQLGSDAPQVCVDWRSQIPIGKGLGSSAAAIVAGVEMARWLHPRGRELMDPPAALRFAAALEGHADNVAACYLGGFVATWSVDKAVHAAQLPCQGVIPVALVPHTRSSTRAARTSLPTVLTREEALFSTARTGLLVAAMAGAAELLMTSTDDVLHQPQRSADMPTTFELIARLRGAGIAAVLSGSGPSVLALIPEEDAPTRAVANLPDGWTAHTLRVGAGIRVVVQAPPQVDGCLYG
jgi:homoserine kinase